MMAANPQAQTDDCENQRHNLEGESYAQGGKAQEGSRWKKTERLPGEIPQWNMLCIPRGEEIRNRKY